MKITDTSADIDPRTRAAEPSNNQQPTTQKLAQNALAPIGRFPAELLVLLVQKLTETISMRDAAHDMINMTSVCSHIRTTLLAAPGLWATVGFGKRWSPSLLDLFLARAASHPLTTTLGDGDDGDNLEFARATPYLPRMGRLTVYLFTSRAKAFLAVIQQDDLPALKNLVLISDMNKFPLRPSLAPGTQLTSIRLDAIMIAEIPAIPSLQHLWMRQTFLSLQQLWELVNDTPRLRTLTLIEAIRRYDGPGRPAALTWEVGVVHNSVRTRSLEELTISDDLARVVAVIEMLPVPVRVLDVSIADEQAQVWSSSTGRNAVVMSRVLQFWTAMREDSEPRPFHPGKVIWSHVYGGFQQRIKYEAHGRYRPSSLHYSSGCKIVADDPALHTIATVIFVSETHARPGRVIVSVDDMHLKWLSHVEDLVLKIAKHTPEAKRDQRHLFMLETWTIARRREGRLLRSIQFQSWPGWVKSLYERLRDDGAAQSVSWK